MRAYAKVNLTLKVIGRRPDRYHVLESLVVFADLADQLTTVGSDAPPAVTYAGPSAAGLTASPDDLVSKAQRLLGLTFPDWPLPHVAVHKEIPQAAGLGGGSADAAAYVHLAMNAAGDAGMIKDRKAALATLVSEAVSLGADVPVCLLRQAAWVGGIGDQLRAVQLEAPFAAVLVRPDANVPTAKTRAVFGALAARPIPDGLRAEGKPPTVDGTVLSRAEVEAAMEAHANDLQAPAVSLMPEIETALEALANTSGARHVRLSGAGPTTLALFDNSDQAAAAADAISTVYPSWWVRAVQLGSPAAFDGSAA